MQTYQGALRLLGNASVDKGFATYSVIEIDDHILKNITVPLTLDNFLNRSLALGGTSTLEIYGSSLLCVKLSDGSSYCQEATAGKGLLLILLGIPLIPFGLGIFMILSSFSEFRKAWFLRKLIENGARAV